MIPIEQDAHGRVTDSRATASAGAKRPGCAGSPASICNVACWMANFFSSSVLARDNAARRRCQLRPDEMGGQCRFGRAHRPDVEVVHVGHAGRAAEMGLYRLGVDAKWVMSKARLEGSRPKPQAL